MTKCYTIFIAFCLLASCNQQQETAPLVPKEDIVLVGDLYQNTLYQINTATEALTRSTSPKTKLLAEGIIKEKEVLKNELESLAGQKAFDLPMDISPQQLEKWQEVVREKGWNYDLKFLSTYGEMWERELQLLQKVVNNAHDKDIKVVAGRLLSNDNDHPELATEIKQFINSRLGNDTTTGILTKNTKK